LRRTSITNLARGGAHPKLAQVLARHSDINLTMSVYTHAELADQAEALKSPPAATMDGEPPFARTGTDGSDA